MSDHSDAAAGGPAGEGSRPPMKTRCSRNCSGLLGGRDFGASHGNDDVEATIEHFPGIGEAFDQQAVRLAQRPVVVRRVRKGGRIETTRLDDGPGAGVSAS